MEFGKQAIIWSSRYLYIYAVVLELHTIVVFDKVSTGQWLLQVAGY